MVVMVGMGVILVLGYRWWLGIEEKSLLQSSIVEEH